jgi:hypothetical protein
MLEREKKSDDEMSDFDFNFAAEMRKLRNDDGVIGSCARS